jgi:CelD/BcsL family acetyltransferase involved in cellulose biosynthesis
MTLAGQARAPAAATRVESLDGLDALRADWERIYAASRAPMTGSWAFFRGWAEATDERWLVVAARRPDTREVCALLPLFAGAPPARRPRVVRQLWARAGLLCEVGAEASAAAAVAGYAQRELAWDRLGVFNNLDASLDALVNAFGGSAFEIRELEPTPHFTLALPDSWERYLHESIGRGNRRLYRLAFRAIEASDRYRLTVAEPATLEPHIEAFLRVYRSRWGRRAIESCISCASSCDAARRRTSSGWRCCGTATGRSRRWRRCSIAAHARRTSGSRRTTMTTQSCDRAAPCSAAACGSSSSKASRRTS